MRIATLLLLTLIPISVLAEGATLTRRDAYLMIWESIRRPAFETAKSYNDIPEEDRGYLEISYGKRRSITIDDDEFRPDEPVVLSDTLLWIYRTRNIRERPDMEFDHLQGMITDYPIVATDQALTSRVTRDQLIKLLQKIDGLLAKEIHEVSFYADYFHGRGTAFGETFDMNDITAAHRSLPHNTLVKVTNVENGESVIVRINDRGPYVDGRDMDLSKGAFGEIAHHGEGLLRATFERLGDPELVDRCEQKRRSYQKRITKDVHFFRGIPHTFSLGDQLILQSSRPFVVLGVTFPDGQYLRIQDFVLPKEKYRFSPDSTGNYMIHVGDTLGREREMKMQVNNCVFPT